MISKAVEIFTNQQSLLLLYQIQYYRQVVAVAIQPFTASLGTQRCPLITTILLDEIISAEHLVIPVLQTAIALLLSILVQKIRSQHNLIEEIPFSSVVKSSLCFLCQDVIPRVIHIPLTNF